MSQSWLFKHRKRDMSLFAKYYYTSGSFLSVCLATWSIISWCPIPLIIWAPVITSALIYRMISSFTIHLMHANLMIIIEHQIPMINGSLANKGDYMLAAASPHANLMI
jgi:hypothetical protein